ncbi:hypothetical protein NNM22_00385 [Enterococcus faecium]|nr:hypothetical protein [Enterococcus faecium]
MKISTNWRKEIQTIPNLLSIFRILLLPIYLYFVLRQSFYVAGLIGLSKNIKLSGAKWYGKVATAVIYVGMILLLLFPELPTLWVRVIFAVITYGLLQSFVLYAVEYRKMFQRK